MEGDLNAVLRETLAEACYQLAIAQEQGDGQAVDSALAILTTAYTGATGRQGERVRDEIRVALEGYEIPVSALEIFATNEGQL